MAVRGVCAIREPHRTLTHSPLTLAHVASAHVFRSRLPVLLHADRNAQLQRDIADTQPLGEAPEALHFLCCRATCATYLASRHVASVRLASGRALARELAFG